MSEITSSNARALSVGQIARELFKAAEFQDRYTAITFEHGVSLVNIVAAHGKQLAKAIALHQELVDTLETVVPTGDDWWCPTCQEGLSGARVTNSECCDTCGTFLGDIATPEWIEKARAVLAKARGE